jgi:hypothetical protein
MKKAPRRGGDYWMQRFGVSSNADANTTGSEIAERAGLSRRAQLYHFPTKEELFAKAVEHLELMFNEMRQKWSSFLSKRIAVPSLSISFGKRLTVPFTKHGSNC